MLIALFHPSRVTGLALLSAALAVTDVRPASTSPEAGLPLIEVFRPRDYDASTHNWSAVQDRHGVLHVANENLVLSYDGRQWRSTPTGGAYRTLLALDPRGRIWLGGADSIGYLDENEFGRHTFTSLWNRLAAADRDYRGTSGLHVIGGEAFFSAWDRLLRPQGDAFAVERGLELPYQPGSPLPFGRTAEGVWRQFDGKAWHVLADTPELRAEEVRSVLPRPDGSALLVTRRQGLWLARDGKAAPFLTEVDATLRARGVTLAVQLRDGTLAVALYPTGFLLLDPAGKLRHFVDSDPDGQAAPLVEAFFEDRDGSLWVLRRTGLARIDWPARLTFFNQTRGLDGSTVRVTRRHQDRVYVGKSGGLFRLEPPAPHAVPATPARFSRVPDCYDAVWELFSIGDDLIIASIGGVRVMGADGAMTQLIPKEVILCLLQSRQHPDVVLAGTERGVFRLQRGAGGWSVEGKLAGVDASISQLVEEPNGDLWISTLNRGFYRVPGFGAAPTAAPEHYVGGHGFPDAELRGEVFVARIGERATFFYNHVLYRFDPVAGRFEKWLSAADKFGSEAIRLERIATGLDGACWAQTMRHDDAAGPWGGRQLWRIDADGTWRQLPFAAHSAAGALPAFNEEKTADGSILWLGGTEALLRAELPAAFVPARAFRARVGQAQADGHRLLSLIATHRAELAPQEHTLRVGFGTDRIDDPAMRFQVRLEGRDDDWQPFETSSTATMTGLGPGRYTLHARARDADGRLSEPASFAFVVLPPWWRTWWAYAGYAAAATVSLTGLVRWRLRAVERRNAELEGLVAQRTGALREREQQLVVARDAAEAANRAKSVFLASMSHDLRTPLNAILGYSQLLRHAPGLDPQARRQLETVHASGDHLLQMINDVLDLAKIEAGKVELLPQPISLSRLLAHLTEVFEPRAGQKKIAFALHGETPLPDQVIADEARLRQVLYNLLGNAIKFTERGRVELRVAAADERVRFTVVDTGIGITPGEQAAIFGLFHQAAGPALSAQGTGLGLAISQRLVRLMGGEITVESEPGQGSRFSFALTLPSAPSAAPTPIAEALPLGYRGPRRRVLIVDDEPVNRDVLRALLEPRGFALEETDDGDTAVARVTAHPPDLVLMDLRLKRLDGLSAMRRIRTLPTPARAVRMMAISASVFPIDRTQAIEAGADEFEPKPIRAAALLLAIGRLLALDWEWPVAPTGSRPALLPDVLPATWPLPSLAVLNELDAHADLGDLAALRACLAAARPAHAGATAFFDALETFAANAQLVPLRDWIARALARNSAAS